MKKNALRLLLSSLLVFPTILPAAPTESVLRVCDDVTDPASLDPFQVFSEKTITIIQQVNEGLLRFNPDGKIEPCLAESWERLNDKSMRFHLRKGVSFHNGETFNASAVKFSLEKYVNPETKYPGFGFVATIASVSVVNDYTVDVVTHIPDGLLLNRLAAFCQIVPPKYYAQVGPAGFNEHPVGTGPFKFEEWDKKQRIIFSANRNYWMPGFPKVDKLVFTFIPSLDQMDALIAGKVDLVTDLPGTMTLHFLEASENTRIIKRASFYTYGASFRVEPGSPLANLNVRKAMNYAIDKEEMIRYDAQSNGIAMATLSMPGETGHNLSLKPYSYNLEKAEQLMKQAGYEKGFPLHVFVKEQGQRVFGIIKNQLSYININLIGEVVPDKDMFQKLTEKKWDVILGNCPDPMAHTFFVQAILLYSKSPFSVYKDQKYDEKLESMMSTLDQALQEKMGQDINKYVYDNSLSWFTYQKVRTYGARRTLYFSPSVTAMSYFYNAYYGKPSEKRAIEIQ